MKKEELTELEIAKISSHNSQIENLKRTLQQVQAKLQKHQQGINEILDQIKERAGLPEDYPVDKLNFEAVNWEEFEGSIIIEDEEGGEE